MAVFVALSIGACARQFIEAPIEFHGTVSAFSIPGLSAMSAVEAKTWIGRSVEYSATRAGFDQSACRDPRYAVRFISASAFESKFQFHPGGLGLQGDLIEVIEVGCPGAWVAPGSVLIRSGGLNFLLWDGVFFQIAP